LKGGSVYGAEGEERKGNVIFGYGRESSGRSQQTPPERRKKREIPGEKKNESPLQYPEIMEKGEKNPAEKKKAIVEPTERSRKGKRIADLHVRKRRKGGEEFFGTSRQDRKKKEEKRGEAALLKTGGAGI